MKVIGLTEELHGEADEQCREGFRAWRSEVSQATWGNWEELQRQYPKACQVAGNEAHFPLRADGTGVRASVDFSLRFLLLLCIAPRPDAMRALRRPGLSVPHN
jgi:hypothetical protein